MGESLGDALRETRDRLANCLANLDRILPLSLWSSVIFWQKKGPGAGRLRSIAQKYKYLRQCRQAMRR